MTEQKFNLGDRVAFLWESMETHHGIISRYHGNHQGKEIYSVKDIETSTLKGYPVYRFLYPQEFILDTDAK